MKRLFTFFSFLLLCLPAVTKAYFVDGTNALWPGPTVPMVLKLGTAPTLIDGSTWNSSAIAAMGEWNRYMKNVQFTWTSSSSTSGANNNSINELFFSSSPYDTQWDSSTLAVTITWYKGTERKESDILFNSTYTWNSYRGSLRYGTGGNLISEFRRVALHELGHVLGLSHSNYGPQYWPAIMNSSISDLDALTADDQAGIGVLYGLGVDNHPAAPVLTATLGDQLAYVGDTVNFYAQVSSTTPVSYIWYKDGKVIPDATQWNYSISAVTNDSGGKYSFGAVNLGGTTTSNEATLTVTNPPAPTIGQLYGGTFTEGDSLSISIYANGRNVAYAWYKDGVLLPGYTTNNLQISVVHKSDAGTYKVVASNAGGSVTSNEVTVTVNAAVRPSISNVPSLINAVRGQYLNIFANVNGTSPMTYRWFHDGRPVGPASNYGYYLSLNNVQPSDAGDYVLMVSNIAGTAESTKLTVTVSADAPSVAPNLLDRTYTKGSAVSLDAYNYNSSITSIQWYKDNVALSGAVGSSYTATQSATYADSGLYTARGTTLSGASILLAAINVSIVDSLYDSNGTILPGAWIDAEQVGSVEYFLYSAPGRLERYDLVSKSWSPRIVFGKTASAFCHDDSFIYVVHPDSISKYPVSGDATGTPVVSFATSPGTIKDLISAGDYLILVLQDLSPIVYSKATGATVANGTPNLRISPGAVYNPSDSTLYFFDTSFTALSKVVLTADGTWGTLTQNYNSRVDGYYGNRRIPLWLNADGSRLIHENGTLFKTGDLSAAETLAGNARDISLQGGALYELTQSGLFRYANGTSSLTQVPLSSPGMVLGTSSSNAFVFSSPPNSTSKPSVAVYSLDSFGDPVNATASDSPTLKYDPSEILMDADGMVYLLDTAGKLIHRWSISTRTYGKTISIPGLPKHFAFNSNFSTGYVSLSNGVVYSVDTSNGKLKNFAVLPSGVSSLETAGDFVVLTDAAYVWSSIRSYTSDGSPVSILPLGGYENSSHLAWSAASRRMYRFNDGSYNNTLFSFAVGTNGVCSDSKSGPYRSDGSAQYPLRVSPDGQIVVIGSGDIFDATSQSRVSKLPAAIADVAWLQDAMYSVRQVLGSSMVSKYDPITFELLSSVQMAGTPLRLMSTDDGHLVLVTSNGGVPSFHILTSNLTEDYSTLVPANKPAVTTQPQGVTLTSGSFTTLSVGTSETEARYQWYRNGQAIEGANRSTLRIDKMDATQAGDYWAAVYTDLGISYSSTATISYSETASRMIDISTRSYVGAGSNVQIAGFVISGNEPKQVLVRASGPAMGVFGLTGLLADPTVALYSGSTIVSENDNWSDDPASGLLLKDAFTSVGAFGFPDASKDAALLATLAPGAYTAVMSGKNSTEGVGLVEVYEVDHAGDNKRLVNISTRSLVKSGAATQIAGFVVTGSANKSVLVRAIGPGLAPFGLTGILADPLLTIYDSAGHQISQNDNWSSADSNALDIIHASASVGAFPLAFDSADAVLLITVPPGSYTAQVSSAANGAEGVSLIEVYELK